MTHRMEFNDPRHYFFIESAHKVMQYPEQTNPITNLQQIKRIQNEDIMHTNKVCHEVLNIFLQGTRVKEQLRSISNVFEYLFLIFLNSDLSTLREFLIWAC